MLTRDQLFLQEYAQYSYLTHITTAVALFQAYGGYRYPQRSIVGLVEEALTQVQTGYPTTRLGKAGRQRLRSICTARLFAEQMAAIEDLGALGWAIQHRNKYGIFKRYLESRTSDVGDFFKKISDCGTETDVFPLLKLPSLLELEQLLSSGFFAATEMDKRYQGYALSLKKMAQLYQTTVDPDPAALAASVTDVEEKVHVVVDVGDSGRPLAPSRSDIYVHTYNRIKHRFAVIESPDAFDQIPDEEKPLFYTHHSLRPKHVKHHVLQIAAIATIGSDLADFLLLLDAHGYPL